jgi:uncharacterized MAPEG superfamily protein
MTVDLWMLAASVALTWGLIMFAATPPLLKDIKWAVGNRSDSIEVAPWAERANRCAQNMKENLPLFATLVLIAQVAETANDTSALGAQIFVAARLAHAVIYVLGIPGLRTLAWATSIGGMALVASSFLG